MRPNTLIMLVIAVVFGALAVFIANQWLASQSRQVAQVAPADTAGAATIVVASVNLPFGTAVDPQMLKEISWPGNALPDGAFARVSQVTSGGRRVVLAPMGPNEPILKWKISGPDARASLSAVVTEGMRAVGIRVNDVVGVGGFVLPGDRVDVLYTRSGNTEMSATDVLIQNTRVLAVDLVADEKNNQPTVAKVVTIEVTAVDAQKIALAQTLGSLSLSLRSAGSLDRAPARRIVSEELTSSPSVYEAEFSARKAEQAALDARLRGLEGQIRGFGERGSGEEELAVEPAEAALPVDSLTTPVDVVRAMKHQTYEVPRDAAAR